MRTIRIVNSVTSLTLRVDETTDFHGAKLSVGSIDQSDLSYRVGLTDRLGRSGSEPTGDGETEAVDLSIRVDLTAQTDTAYRAAASALLALFRRQYDPIYLYDDQDGPVEPTGAIPVRARVRLKSETITGRENLYARHHSGALKLTILDAFWESQDEYSAASPTGGTADQGTIDCVNPGDWETYPVITVTALAYLPLFRLTDTTTGAFVEIGSVDFLEGRTITIDSVTGSIDLDGTDISATTLGEGSSLPVLAPGTNTLRYESSYGPADITVTWRTRWPR